MCSVAVAAVAAKQAALLESVRSGPLSSRGIGDRAHA
jgi:hypothetical protein